MKKPIWILIVVTVFAACKAQYALSQDFHAYQSSYDHKDRKVLRGLITRSDIQNDTAFSWFKKNYNLGKPDAGALDAFKKHANDFHVLVFLGTWCPDTQNLLPQFYQLTDAAGYPDSSITLIGVDNDKTTLDNLHTTFHLVDVPTFIIMKDGKEVGRVVEYGESGEAMKELGQIVNKL